MRKRSMGSWLVSASIITMATLHAGAAASQEETAPAAGATTLKPIVVTGEKTSRDIKHTASSVSVKTDEVIKTRNSGNPSVSDAVKDIPNVIYTDSVSAPIIRGQDTQGPNTGSIAFFTGTVPRATINVDGHYLGYNEFIYGASSIWDVESIEVFRGPQTSSQGANAIAGAILVNTKDPTYTPEAAYQAEIGNYHQKRGSVVFSGPLIEDELAARLALDYSGRETFIRYVNSNFAREGTDQDFKQFNGRLKLLWEPLEVPGLSTKLTYSYSSTNRPSQEAASRPFRDLRHITTTMPSFGQNTHTGILDINYDFENGVKLFNQTQYSSTKSRRRVGIPNNGDADIGLKNASHESRISFGDQEEGLSGFAGIFYAHSKSDELLLLRGTSRFDDTKRNLGLFGELNYRFADKWTLTGGLRYQHDNIMRSGYRDLGAGRRSPVDYNESFSEFLPKISLAYDINDQWTAGALISRGYNPGGMAYDLASSKWRDFEKETLWNYEIFSRATILDDTLTLNTNLFYMDMKNGQFNVPVNISPGLAESYTVNAEKAHAYGLEIGVDYQVLDNLILRTSAGLLKTKIREISSNADFIRKEFAKSPGYSITLGASWDVTEKFNVTGKARFIDSYYSDTDNKSQYAISSYAIADLRASYKVNDAMEVYGYVKNIFDGRAPTLMKENRGIGGIEASMTEPRMFGVGVRGNF